MSLRAADATTSTMTTDVTERVLALTCAPAPAYGVALLGMMLDLLTKDWSLRRLDAHPVRLFAEFIQLTAGTSGGAALGVSPSFPPTPRGTAHITR